MEEWRWIPGLEGRYAASSLGRVRSHLGPAPRIIGKNPTRAHGYRTLCLCPGDGGRKVEYVHAVIALAFLGPRPEGLVIRHLNGIKVDCRVSNLAYGTPAENTQDTFRHGTTAAHRRTHCDSGHDLAEVGIVRGTISACALCHSHKLDRLTEYRRKLRGSKKRQSPRRKPFRVEREVS